MSRRGTELDPEALAALEEERDFLLRSLDDLEAERAAGDVDDHDYRTLRDEYTARAAAAIRAVEDRRERVADAEVEAPRAPWRSGLVVGGVVVLALVTGVVMAQASGRRDSGDQLSGDIRRSVRSEVDECISGEDPGEPVATLECYDAVLEEQPSNTRALTYRGWFLVRLGTGGGEGTGELLRLGLDSLDAAIESDARFPDARVFRAVAYRELGDTDRALEELDAFDELDAPRQAQQLADQLRAGLEAAAGGGTVPTTTTVTTAPG